MLLFCKQINVALLLMAVMLQSFSKAVIFVDFYANRDYIAKNLCENRRTPIIHCYGRCQLNKRLLEDEKQDSSSPERKETAWGVLLYAESGQAIGLWTPAASSRSHAPALSDCRMIDQPSFCFHPPD
jgi:hypothetical protein